MNVVDLELYRWQLHRMGAFNPLKLKPRSMGLSKLAWWTEGGAFISMVPRQAGKTEILIRMAKIFQEEGEDFIFIVSHQNMKNIILSRISMDPKRIEVILTATTSFNFREATDKNKTNLLIDEYMCLDKNALMEIFKMDWKSISMTGGLKL